MSDTTRMTFPRSVLAAVVAVLLLAVAAMVWWPDSTASTASTTSTTSTIPTATASVGDRVEVGSIPADASYGGVDDEYFSTEAPLPHGTVTVTAEVGRAIETDTGARRVLDGKARWVRVQWSPRQATSGLLATWPGTTARDLEEPPSKIVLRVDGKDHVVADDVISSSPGRSVALAVEDPHDVRVLVAVAGRSLHRAVPSDEAATGLRTKDVDPPDGCDDEGDSTSPGCDLYAVRSPYVIGLGAAPQDKEWLLVRGVKPHQQATAGAGDKPVKTSPRAPGSPLSETRAFLVPANQQADVQVHCPKSEPKPGDPAVATDQSTVCATFILSHKDEG